MSYFIFVVSSGSILTSRQLQPCPHPPHQPASSDLPPPGKQPTTDVLPQYQTPVQQYASYLKSVYTREKLPIYDKWPQVKSKKYINLALIEKEDITKPEADQFTRATIHGNIDDIKKSKRAMDIGQIAQLPDGSQPKCILVEGAPGVGKSTFAWKLCRKWGKGKLLQQYQLVVLLKLRDKSVRVAKNISNLFRYHNHQIQQAAVEEIQRTGGKGVLLLFEGYDELPEEIRSKSSIFLDVITGRELPEATVLITGRPWASEFLHQEYKGCISQHIEILGFTKDNIQSYLKSTIPDDPSSLADLKKYISCYPHIGSLMYIPLNSAIVVEVYRKEETLVPKTMTELYSSLFRSLLLRHLLDHPVHGKKRRWRVRSFSDLPQDVYQQLCELGRIAYEGILHDQQVIFSDLPENFETLDLMQCAPELYADEGAAVSYNFLHLTMQEYLAAFHLSQQPVEKQIEQFKGHNRSNKHHFLMVLRFVCGINKFTGYSGEVLNTLCVKESSDDSSSVIHEVTFDALHWLFEAQENDIIANLLGSSDIQLDTFLSTLTPFDCFVLGYCVSHSNCNWKINLTLCHIGDEGVEMLVRGAVEEETHCTGGISEINLSGNDLISEGMKQLLKFPKQFITKLETLDLNSNSLDSESCADLARLIPHVPHLKKLSLCDNFNIGQGGGVSLMTSLTTHNSLETLKIDNTGIGVEDCLALGELLSSSTSLKKLIIGNDDIALDSDAKSDYNALPPEAVELIISGLHHNTTLERLDMSNSHFSPLTIDLLASLLETNHTLVCLKLRNCNIVLDGACQLASTLHELDLRDNLIGVEGATAFAEMLRTNHTLVNLNLGDCNIDSDGTCQLASALCTNDTLQKLNLEDNPVGVNGAIAFAEMLKTNHTLVHLSLKRCDIDSDGACQLASALCTNDTLQKLHLRGNPIEVEGSTAFGEMLRTNHTLVDLDLTQCDIDSKGACQLASALCTNDTLQKLYLKGNPIGVEGATAFAEMLLKNKSLKELELRDNSMGEEGTQKLIDSLAHNTTLKELWLPKKYPLPVMK